MLSWLGLGKIGEWLRGAFHGALILSFLEFLCITIVTHTLILHHFYWVWKIENKNNIWISSENISRLYRNQNSSQKYNFCLVPRLLLKRNPINIICLHVYCVFNLQAIYSIELLNDVVCWCPTKLFFNRKYWIAR